MQFTDIPGNKDEKQLLIQQSKNQRIPHAQIFLGSEGSAVLPLALAFSSYLVCTDKQDTESCGKCPACLKSYRFIHPDIHYAFPVVKLDDKLKREDTTSENFLVPWREILTINPYMGITQWLSHIKADKSQANINVKECNDILHKLNMMSYESTYKILIMWLPEYLGKEGNRLLKIIEEPPENTVIILVAQNQNKILSTILSRCQLLKVHMFEDQEILAFLQDKIGLELEKARQISHLVNGNLNKAIGISKNDETDYSEMLTSWMRLCYNPDPVKLQEWINGMAGISKDEQKNFFEYGIHFLRQFIYMQLTGSKQVNLTQKELTIAENMQKVLDVTKAEAISNTMNDAIDSISGNANIKILLTSDTLLIGDIMKGKEKLTLHSIYDY